MQTFTERIVNFAMHQAMLRVVLPLSFNQINDLRRIFNVGTLASWAEWRRDVLLYLVNSHPALDYPRALPPEVKARLMTRPATISPPWETMAALQAVQPRSVAACVQLTRTRWPSVCAACCSTGGQACPAAAAIAAARDG